MSGLFDALRKLLQTKHAPQVLCFLLCAVFAGSLQGVWFLQMRPFRHALLGFACPSSLHMRNTSRSSSREVGIRVPFFSVVYFGRGTLPQKKRVEGHYWGNYTLSSWSSKSHLWEPPPRIGLLNALYFETFLPLASVPGQDGRRNAQPGVH